MHIRVVPLGVRAVIPVVILRRRDDYPWVVVVPWVPAEPGKAIVVMDKTAMPGVKGEPMMAATVMPATAVMPASAVMSASAMMSTARSIKRCHHERKRCH